MTQDRHSDGPDEAEERRFRNRYLIPSCVLATIVIVAARFGPMVAPSWVIFVTMVGAGSGIVMLGALLCLEAESPD